jgi:hypothetical protein
MDFLTIFSLMLASVKNKPAHSAHPEAMGGCVPTSVYPFAGVSPLESY